MDERVKVMNEVIAGMRVIKMYTWEDSFSKWIRQIRGYDYLSDAVGCSACFLAGNLAF